MAKTPKSAPRGGRSRRKKGAGAGGGKQLVIVESPAKAKTINRYLGPEYVVKASIGHVRDLPRKAPKGSKQPVPGVDLDNDFQPTYVVLPEKKKALAALKKAAQNATGVWFATDLDREGEAIAWHLAQELSIDPAQAKRVIFNAITKSQITHAFDHPHAIDMFKVNAQQARRILDRIVGYQVSPLLWKKVARGLSAGRVQSVAARLIVDRERVIRAFVPDEYWRVTARLGPLDVEGLTDQWVRFMRESSDAKGKPPTIKAQNNWLSQRQAIKAELVELGGQKFVLGCPAGEPRDLAADIRAVAEAAGLCDVTVHSVTDEQGKGPARVRKSVEGRIEPGVRYRVSSVQTKRTTSKPPPPFITASLQAGAASSLGFTALRTMRVAQNLYEGVDVPGEGQVGLITYMRTDSTNITSEALAETRTFITETLGEQYLPGRPHVFGRSSAAQEAHEAIRPTDVRRRPDDVAPALTDEQKKLYRLIWNRFVACQMAAAQWDSTAVLLERSDETTGAVLRATGRVLVFDGFCRIAGLPTNGDELLLPKLRAEQALAPFSIEPEQLFTSAQPRYSEASLIKALEAEGIGRPSTYAQIIQVIQSRNYVEQIDRRFYATDLGEVVTDKLVQAFPRLMDTGYTRGMETELDKIEEQHTDWLTMLRTFYERFSASLEKAHETLKHAKAERQPAIYKCPECGSQTCYRFGKNGRFLSCTAYPKCTYAAPINREGRPLLPQRVNVACPADDSPMLLRTGRFGPFLASVNYPDIDCVINVDKKGLIKYPAPPPLLTDLTCPKCEAPMNLRRGKRGPWLGCSTYPRCRGRLSFSKLTDAERADLSTRLEVHERAHPPITIRTLQGQTIDPGTPVRDLLVSSGLAELEVHPAAKPLRATA